MCGREGCDGSGAAAEVTIRLAMITVIMIIIIMIIVMMICLIILIIIITRCDGSTVTSHNVNSQKFKSRGSQIPCPNKYAELCAEP